MTHEALSMPVKKVLAGRIVQDHIERARKFPGKIARMIMERGIWENKSLKQGKRQVEEMVRHIDGGTNYKAMPIRKEPVKARRPRVKKDDGQSLLPLEMFKPKNADKKWDPETRDYALNLLFEGNSYTRISRDPKISRSKIAIKRLYNTFRFNEFDVATEYQTVRRLWRGGKKFSLREEILIKAHQKRKIPTAVTARVLCRKPKEIRPDAEGAIQLNRLLEVAPRVDTLWAERYLRNCAHQPTLSEETYQEAVAEEIEFGGGYDILMNPASNSDKVTDYPPHIRSLAYYILFKAMQKAGKWNHDKLPYSWKEK